MRRLGSDRGAPGSPAVEFSETAVRLPGAGAGAAVPRERIRHIALVYDTEARYPFTRFFVGFLLVALGGIGLVVLFLTGLRESLPVDLESGVLSLNLVPAALWLMVALGLWALAGVLRASYQLAIETDQGTRRVVLGSAADLPDIRQLIAGATRSFGYEIDASILEQTAAPG